mmetsp:Transcript_11016/g.37503  ORF Transcript_11016/g.37503 Transcript_11016/m.37503 type:complete len:429 (+) Transcript_11016:934-2220(+)
MADQHHLASRRGEGAHLAPRISSGVGDWGRGEWRRAVGHGGNGGSVEEDHAGRGERQKRHHGLREAGARHKGLQPPLQLRPEVPCKRTHRERPRPRGSEDGLERTRGLHRDGRAGAVGALLERRVVEHELEAGGQARVTGEEKVEQHHALGRRAVAARQVARSLERTELRGDPPRRLPGARGVLVIEEVRRDTQRHLVAQPRGKGGRQQGKFAARSTSHARAQPRGPRAGQAERPQAGHAVDGRGLKGGHFQAGEVRGTSERVGGEEGEVLVVGRVELPLLVHVALRCLHIEQSVLVHGRGTVTKKLHRRRHVRHHVLRNDRVQPHPRAIGRPHALRAPKAHTHVVALGYGGGHDVGRRVHAVGLPPELLEGVQLRTVVARQLQHRALPAEALPARLGRRVCLRGHLACEPLKVLEERAGRAAHVEVL